MTLSEELQARGFIYQCSAENLSEVLDGEKRTVYLGIDPTADSIHVGNLVPYMLLNRLLQAGHKVILLMGGGTALIGDPGGKNEERPFAEAAVIAQQAEKMEAGIRRFVSGDITFVNNYDWLSQISMIDYLRNVGKHFTVNAMIKKDIVANRLDSENPISYTEFSYSLLQGYDFVHLHKEHGCDLQIGGSDQWSNIIAGVDLIRKMSGDEVYALTLPLVTDKATGKKFGKSEGNAVWLNPEKTTPYDFYQFWLNTSDESVIDYLKIFTFLSLEEVATLEQQQQQDPGARVAQKRLAADVTAFVHGEETAVAVEQVTKTLFGESNIADLDDDALAILRTNAPLQSVAEGESVVEVLVASGLASSKREARTFITSGAVSCNGQKVVDEAAEVSKEAGALQLLKRGKKQLVVLEMKK